MSNRQGKVAPFAFCGETCPHGREHCRTDRRGCERRSPEWLGIDPAAIADVMADTARHATVGVPGTHFCQVCKAFVVSVGHPHLLSLV
jgi:hypothetical protein